MMGGASSSYYRRLDLLVCDACQGKIALRMDWTSSLDRAHSAKLGALCARSGQLYELF